jgi:hypothetical protein
VQEFPDKTARVDRSEDHDKIGSELIAIHESHDRLTEHRAQEREGRGEPRGEDESIEQR